MRLPMIQRHSDGQQNLINAAQKVARCNGGKARQRDFPKFRCKFSRHLRLSLALVGQSQMI
jgi:hypothetical protein